MLEKRQLLSALLTAGVLALSFLGVAKGLSAIADLTPPSEVQSSNNTAANGSTRYNLNTGAAFNISCSFTHTSDSFSSYFYKDGVVISDGSLVNTTLTELHPSTNQTFIQLQFLNFQPVHDGVYYCSANTSDTNETVTSDLYLYGSGLTLIPSLIPPPGVRSSNTAFTNSQFRYNLNTGAAFNISCSSTDTSDAFTVSFYKDGVVINEGDLVDTTLTETALSSTQKVIQLEFLNYQPVHDGVYHCFSNTSNACVVESSDLYLYGSESPPPPPVRVTPRYVVLDTSGDLVLEARFRGNFYIHEWVYSEDDPTFLTGTTSLFTPATVTNVGQTYTIPAGSASLRAGYYGPRVTPTLTGTSIRPTPENTVIVGSFVAPNAFINGLSTAQVTAAAGDDVTFTCLARGFPETTITIQLSGVNASYTLGNQTLMTEATPTSFMEVTRTVTLHSVTVLDCGAVVTCEGSNMNSDGSTHTDQANATLQVQAPPTVGVTSSEPVLSVGNMLTLTCTGSDCVRTTTFTFSWFLDGSPVEASLVTSLDGTTSQLSVTSVTSADFGTYTCNVTNEHGTGSAVAYVRERGFLEFTTDLTAPPTASLHSSLSVLDGQTNRYNIEPNASFSLTCTAESPDNFTLSVSRMPSSATSPFTSDVADSMTTMPSTFVKTLTLTYSHFTADLNGIYWCRAVSLITSNNELESRHVLLGTGPAAVTRVSDLYIELIPPNSLELQVMVAGAYESLTWSRGGAELAGSGSVSFSDFRQTLTVSSTSAGDVGEYTAAVSGSESVTFQVQEFRAPQITVSALTYVIQGDTLTVNCSVTSFPQSNVSLSLNGTPIMTSVSEAYDSTAGSFTYFTTHSTTAVHPSDEGNYTCSATITHGQPAVTEVFSDTTFVAVYVRPTVTLSPSVSGPVSVRDVVIFTCTALGGVPSEYSFRWFNGSVEVMSDDSVHITSDGDTSTLMLTVGPDDFVNYTCSVNNTFTEALESIVLVEASFPVPFITPESPDPVVLGSSITLTCASHGMGSFNLTWSVNRILLAREEDVNTSLSLTVDLISTDNYTSYTCTSQNRDGVNSTSATLEQAVPPVVTVVGDPTVTVTVNDSFSLQVTLSQYNLQPVTVEWERNGVPLSSGEKYQLSSDTSQLGDGSAELTVQFTEALMDNGTYTVTASNAAGNGSVDFEVIIMSECEMIAACTDAPEAAILDSQKPTVTFSEGAFGALMCMATGVPAPTISWFRNGMLLSSDGVTFVISSSTDATMSLLSVTSTLNVTSVTRESAFATITCTASNEVGANSSDSTQLILLFAPNVTAVSANQTVTSPAPVSFHCTVDSYPPSNITWLHNGAEVWAAPPRVTISTVQVDNRTQESTLTLLNTTSEDTGIYTCSAVNSVGSVNMTTELQVLVAPEVINISQDLLTVSPDPVVMFCEATGYPRPTISWFFNVALVTVNEKVTIDTVVSPLENTTLWLGRVTSYLRLSVTHPSDAGVYECVSSNLLGRTTDRTNLSVHLPPEVSPTDGVTSKSTSAGHPITVSFFVANEPVPNVTKDGIHWVFTGIGGAVNLSCISTSKYSFSDNCLSLTVRNTEGSDAGLYQITVTTEAGIGMSAVEITVRKSEPRIVRQLVNTTLSQGDFHTFICEAVADPPPLLVFRFNGERITSNSSKHTVVTNRTHGFLTVINIQGSDEGTYSCSASNRFGSVSTAAVLTVEVPPLLTGFPSALRDVVSGETLDASCQATARPAPVIQWFREGQLLTDGDQAPAGVSISQSNEGTTTSSRLTVTGFTPKEAGVYSCVAVNSLGNDSKSFQVRTVVRPNITGINCSVNGSVGKALFHEGMLSFDEFTPQLELTCEAYGLPPPDVIWLNNGLVLHNITGRRVITVEGRESLGELGNLTRSTLSLSVVQLSDAGEYTCRATSGNVSPILGTTAWTFMLQVTELDECVPAPCLNGGTCVDGVRDYTCNCDSFTEDGVLIYYTGRNCGTVVDNREAPSVTKAPSSEKVKLNDKISLTCSATGNPTPSIRWYKDGKPIEGPQAIGEVFVIPEATPTKRGFYHCEAFSSFGDPAKSVEVLILIEGILQFRIEITIENGNSSSRKKRQSNTNTDIIENLRLQIVNQPLTVEGNYTATVYSVEPAGDNSSDIVITVATDSSDAPATLTEQLIQPLEQMLEEVSDINEQVTFTILSTKRHDGCPKLLDSVCGNVGTVTWPETEIGQEASVPCQCGLEDPLIQLLSGTRRCGGTYDTGAEWEEAQCDDCIFSDTRRDLCALAEIDSPAQLANVLVDVTNDSDEIESEDVSLTVGLLDTVTQSTEDLQQEDVQTDILLIVSNVQQVPAEQVAESQRKTNSSNRILEFVEDVLNVVEVTPEDPFEFAAPDFGVRVEDPPEDLGEAETFSPNLGALLSQVMSSTTTSTEMSEMPSAAVTLSSTLLQRDDKGNRPRISTSVFARATLFQQRDSFNRRNNLANQIVGGIVLDLTLRSKGEVKTVLGTPNSNLVRPHFTKSMRDRDEESITTCRFWNFTADEGFGVWDNSSCRVLHETEVEVMCGCDHLTHFAILLDISPDPTPPTTSGVALTGVSYIGAVLSIICLSIIIITYLGEKNLRKALHVKLLLNLCAALFGLYVTFIISTVSMSVPVLCGVVSALMHYFFLAVFFWMGAEAIHLHRKLVSVFKPDIKSYILIAMAICWVVPAFIVVFSLAPYYHNYIHEQYCRVYGYSFYIGLLIPFGFIYIMNWIIFILIFASLLCRPNVQKEASNRSSMRKLKENFMVALGLSLLFGIGWAVGLLASSDAPDAVRLPAEWIFTIVNAFLGVYLFVFYVVRSPEARKLWKKWLCCQRKKSIDLPRSSTRRTWYSTLRFWGKQSTLRKAGKDTSNVASANIEYFSNTGAMPNIKSSYTEPSSVMVSSTAGIMSPTLSPVEIELFPFDPDGQSGNGEATQTVFPLKQPVNLEVETPAQSTSSLSHTASDCGILENKETDGPDFIPR